MKKSELELVEVYVFANHIQGLSTCVQLQNSESNSYVYEFGRWIENLSKKMIRSCEKKLKKKKLSSLSFLILKKEISGFKFYTNGEKNLLSLCNLLEKFNFYENVLINC